jgi:hypothetical protein
MQHHAADSLVVIRCLLIRLDRQFRQKLYRRIFIGFMPSAKMKYLNNIKAIKICLLLIIGAPISLNEKCGNWKLAFII